MISVSFTFVVHLRFNPLPGIFNRQKNKSTVVVKLNLRVAGRIFEIQIGYFAKDATALRQCSVNPTDW